MGFDVWCKACGCKMKERTGKHGRFWGCTAYPHCKWTVSTRDAALEHDPPNDDWGYADYYLEPPDGSD